MTASRALCLIVLCAALLPGCQAAKEFVETSWVAIPAAPYLQPDGSFSLTSPVRHALETDLEGSDVLDARLVGDELYVKVESEAEELGEGLMERLAESPWSWGTLGVLAIYIGRFFYKRRGFKKVPAPPP